MSRPIHVVAWTAIQAIPELKLVYDTYVVQQEEMSGDDIWNFCVRNLRFIPPEWRKKFTRAQDADESEMGMSQRH